MAFEFRSRSLSVAPAITKPCPISTRAIAANSHLRRFNNAAALSRHDLRYNETVVATTSQEQALRLVKLRLNRLPPEVGRRSFSGGQTVVRVFRSDVGYAVHRPCTCGMYPWWQIRRS